MKKRAPKFLSVMLILMLIFSLTLQVYAVDATTTATPWDGKVTPGWKAPTTSSPVVASTTGTYVVKSGDTIWKIAKAHGFTTAQLLALNPTVKDANLIYIGQKLVVKAATAAAPAPAPAPTAPAAPAREPGLYVDAVASASVHLTKEAQIAASLGEKGTWITTLAGNVTAVNDLVWKGDIRKDADTLGRKFGLYYHSSPNIGPELVYTLKVPNLIVKAEKATLTYGTLDGNVKVEANGFTLQYITVTGNVEFATQAQYDSAKFNEIVIKGDVIVAGVKKDSKNKPQTITNFGKYSAVPTKSDMMKAAVTFKDGKAHDVVIDVFGPDYWMKPGILSSGNQGNWGKVSYSKAGQYVMQKPSADRPADTILAWDKQMAELIKQYKASGYDLSKFPTCERDATHPSVLDFNKMLGGKYAAYTVSATNGAIDATKLKGAERSAVVKADAITSVTVDVGKYMKLADEIVKAGTK